MPRGHGGVQRKVLLLLLGGFVLGLSGSPKTYFQVLRGIAKDWEEINRQSLKRAIRCLYESKLISEKQNSDDTVTITLTLDGKKKALTYDLNNMKIEKPKFWDKKWRIVLFDIPDKLKKIREALRGHLKTLGFCEYQESVFIYPYNCKDEIDYLIEFYNIRKFVRFIIAESLDNELYLKDRFNLL